LNIPIAKTVFETQDFEEILKPLKSGWVVQGPLVKEFETKWSNFTGAKHSIAVSNCTTALHLCLAALGITQRDEVIVPAFTWVSTANVVEYLNAKPVFCDVDPKTFNLDVDQLESLVTSRTKAIIPVHLFGLPLDMEPLNSIARKHGLFVVEDAACGFAAKHRGIHVGNSSNAGCFSFHPRKAITTGEGGMITTADDDLAIKLRSMRDHGASITDLQRHQGNKPYLLPEFPWLGYNYRMTDIQGAIGSTQMDRAERIYQQRLKVANRYNHDLAGIEWLTLPTVNPDIQHGYQAYVCMFGGSEITSEQVPKVNQKRNSFMELLQSKGISTRPGTHAVHLLGHYKEKYEIETEMFPNAYISDQCSLALPLYPSMSDEEINYVIDTVRSADSLKASSK